MSGIVDTITGVFKTESNNAANVKAGMNSFAANANTKTYGTAAAAPKKNSGFLNTITGLFASENDPALNVRAKTMRMNKNANNTLYGKNANNGWFATLKQAFKPRTRPLNPNAPEYIPQSTAARIAPAANATTQGGTRARSTRRNARRNARRN
jgi:hypothetical protein